LAKAADQFRASDITVWGIAAMVCGGLAVLSANVSALIPQSVLAGLHASRLEGGSLNQLRSQVANLEVEAAELRRANAELQVRFTLAERQDGDVAKRVGALEVSIPNLLERIPTDEIDTSSITASIPDGDTLTFEADGGTVTIRRELLFPQAADQAPPTQPMPDVASAMPEPLAPQFGLALGQAVSKGGEQAAWELLKSKVGGLLFGLRALTIVNSEGMRLVAGPLQSRSEADALCERIARSGISCTAVPFMGTPL
jgi:hypothetical protein